jgi:hypothetical protein
MVTSSPKPFIEGLLIARQAESPGPLADQNVAQDLARGDVDHRDTGGVAKRDIGGLAVPGDAQIDRGHVALAHARRQEFNLPLDGEAPAVDDVDLSG